MQFDHEKLHVYQVSLEFVGFVCTLTADLKAEHRNARDQLIRASQSIPLNIAEGNGKRAIRERLRFLEIARGSAMESAAGLDILVRIGACSKEQVEPGKTLRLVAMLSKMTDVRVDAARDGGSAYGENENDYEHEHEHEQEHEHEHGKGEGKR